MNKGSILENLLVTDAGAEGKAVARHEDRVIFIRNAVPGDIIDVSITRVKKKFAEARLLRVVKEGENRQEPFCRHFGICGGCKWQNMKYEAQLEYKQKLVEDNLVRIGKLNIGEFLPILPSPLTRNYRNKMEYSFSNMRYLTAEDRAIPDEEKNLNGLGFHVSPSFFRVLDLHECHLPPVISDKIRMAVRNYALEHRLSYYDILKHEGFLRNLLTRHTLDGQCLVILVVGHEDREQREALLDFISGSFPEVTSLYYVINEKKNDIISDLPVKLYRGNPYLEETLGNTRFRIGPVSFFQTNSYQVLHLYEKIKEFAALRGNETVYDLYTGTGTIANFVAREAGRVIGIENVPQAIEDAKENSKLNGIANTEFFAGDMAKVLNEDFCAAHGKPEVIITDPPRSGMHPKVVEQILKAAPERIVYVSCNPATQARDAEILKEKYDIVRVQPVDMFPHTQHVESVMVLCLKKSET